MESDEIEDVSIATLGMFIIDAFRFEDAQTGENLGDQGLGEQIGGGGTYFVIGARIWIQPSKIMMIVDRGNDFTDKMQCILDKFAKTENLKSNYSLWRYRKRSDGTTRAINIYRGQERGFAYTTPKLRLDPKDLLKDNKDHFPKLIHCICSPERVIEMSKQIDDLQKHWRKGKRPIIAWEPIPDSAIYANLDSTIDICSKSIDILSPNHEEAANLVGESLPKSNNIKEQKQAIESVADQIRKAILKKSNHCPLICIRSGAIGSFNLLSNNESIWIPAFHKTELEQKKVVDVTGAGNAFMGGFCVGLIQTGKDLSNLTLEDVQLSAEMGSISASFIIEQQSLPKFEIINGKEKWNNEIASHRLDRIQQYVE